MTLRAKVLVVGPGQVRWCTGRAASQLHPQLRLASRGSFLLNLAKTLASSPRSTNLGLVCNLHSVARPGFATSGPM